MVLIYALGELQIMTKKTTTEIMELTRCPKRCDRKEEVEGRVCLV